MSVKSLVGTWALESWELVDSDGAVTHPFGRRPLGYLMYGPEGYMSVALMAAERKPFAGDDILAGSPEEKSAAVETCIAYSGRYEILGNLVRHHVEISLFPNWIGTTLERIVAHQGDTMRLSTQPGLIGGRTQTAHLVWRKRK
jgi:hypothetical protein